MGWLLIYFTIFHSLACLKEWWIYKLFVEYQLRLRSSICDTGITKEQSSPTHNFPWWVKWRGKNNWNPSLSPRVKPPWMPSAFVRASSPMGTLLDNYVIGSIPTRYSRRHDQKTTYYASGTDNTVSMRAPYSPTTSTWTKNKPQIWWRTTLGCFSTTEIGLLSGHQGKTAKVDLSEFVNELIGWVNDALVLTSQIKKEFVIAISQTDQERRNAQEKNLVKRTSNLSLCC
jgi:hypothetical protein